MGLFNKKNKEENSHEDPSKKAATGGTIYQCPMKCEGEKTYDKPGRCPVCKMYLQLVKYPSMPSVWAAFVLVE